MCGAIPTVQKNILEVFFQDWTDNLLEYSLGRNILFLGQ